MSAYCIFYSGYISDDCSEHVHIYIILGDVEVYLPMSVLPRHNSQILLTAKRVSLREFRSINTQTFK